MSCKFSELCRICLMKCENMKNLIDSSPEACEVISMLSLVLNSEMQIMEGLPSYMCIDCENKLKISYEFQQRGLKSQHVISEYIETKIIVVDQKQTDILTSNSNCDEFMMEESIEDISILHKDHEENSHETSLIKKTAKIKFSQHDPNEVMNIINKIKLKFHEAKQCLLCTFLGINSRALSLHMNKNHGDFKDRWCRKCNQIEENLLDHAKNRHKNDLKCPLCGKKHRSSSYLVEHLLCHSDKQSLLSDYKLDEVSKCNRGTNKSKKDVCYKQEEKNEESELHPNKFCNYCNEEVEDFNSHIKIYHDNSSTEDTNKGLCTFCGKQFKNQSYLTVHLRRHTKETKYKCMYCDAATVTRAQLQEHERTHTGEKPYVCSFCGKAFIQRSVLTTHIKIHTGRTELCQFCPKKFCRPSELQNHMRKHTGEKPFVCTYCDRTFIQRSHLTDHLKTHTNNRPFKCHLCDKAFKQSSTLKAHISIHQGKNVYKCEMCSYTCKKNYTLTLHKRHKHIDQDNYKCDICETSFHSEDSLAAHQNTNHSSIEIIGDITENCLDNSKYEILYCNR